MTIDELIAQRIYWYTQALELACEQMMVSDKGGVLAVFRSDGTFTVSLDQSVPWGTIHEHQEYASAST